MAKAPAYLTETQKAILEFVQEFSRRQGMAPTHREICERFGYSSYGTVYKHLKLLAAKGYLRRDWNQKRGMELLRAIPGSAFLEHEAEVPFLGRIAAGQPLEALPGPETVAVPGHLLSGSARDHYVLRVVGDSMIGEGIHDGDLVIVQKREGAEPGEMVVALIGNEATLKRFYPEGKDVRLQPANPAMQPMRFPAREVRIQGVVVGLMRRF